MRKHFTIEKITFGAFILTLFLLLIAAFIFYKNSLHLQEIKRKENAEKKNESAIKLTDSFSTNTIFPDSREIFRPEILHTNPVAGLQLSIAEYMVAIYILNLYHEKDNKATPFRKKKTKHLVTGIENYQLTANNYGNLLIILIFSIVTLIQLCLYHMINKKVPVKEKKQATEKFIAKFEMNTFQRFNYSKKIKSIFIYSFFGFNFKPLLIFKNPFVNPEKSTKNGIKLKIESNRIWMKKPIDKTKIK
ncbi:MAG: hypothetical protein H0V01_00400 [Bacteroidetes bacterium]|nr:hypothetical protein [Bacteroidota bacterium]HET6245664.1 hypothetical protein [Bacteroidia bacterium]